MNQFIKITSQDGHVFSAYQSLPQGQAKGGIIILQEIFGVNRHIREVCDDYAAAGWSVLAPALFDRAEADVQLDYDSDEIARGLSLKEKVDALAETDIVACLAKFPADLKTAVIGYCWGGSLAWRMACRHDGLDAAVSYYGGEVPKLKKEQPRCVVQAHFGRQDASIPMEGVDAFMAARPDVGVFIYDADHGFNCTHREQYNADAAAEARKRVDEFLARNLTV